MSELHILTGGEKLWTHDTAACKTETNCSIHNPSFHHMTLWPMHWRGDRRMMERICEHGVGHPDPDDAIYRATQGDHDTTHGCDLCCQPTPVATDTTLVDYLPIQRGQDQEASDLQV
jgi:hypothetical protein